MTGVVHGFELARFCPQPKSEATDDGASARMAAEWLTIAGVSTLPKEQVLTHKFAHSGRG